jgi:hypothetical protein
MSLLQATSALLGSLDVERRFWPALDAPFKKLLEELPRDKSGFDDDQEYGVIQLRLWSATVREAARDAFEGTASGLAPNLRSHKAIAKAEAAFYRGLKSALGGYEPAREEL